jgi:hypothetical protein
VERGEWRVERGERSVERGEWGVESGERNVLQVFLIVLHAMSVLHKDGEGGLTDKAEAEALEHLPVLRLREYLH